MRRRFFECAILLGVVMSVMFLAQTQDVIGHDKSNTKKGPPHKPPGHTHNSSTNVDSEGKPVDIGGQDPIGNHYSGDDGIGETDATAWGIRYWGGKYSPSPGDEDNATQNVYAVRVDAEASTGPAHAKITVTPGIDQLRQFPDTAGNWQGVATGEVSFSGVCFHRERSFVGIGTGCTERHRTGDSWEESGFIDLEVKTVKISKGDKQTYGAGFESNGAKLTANSEHSYTASYDELHARGYRFMLKLKGGFLDQMPLFQDKDASGRGQLMNKKVQSNTATAAYRWTNWKKCYCGRSKTPWF